MPAYALQFIPTLERLRAQREEILALAEQYGATNVRVFGSVARGEATHESDIDLLVSFQSNYKLLHHAGLWASLKMLLQAEIDLSVEENLKEGYKATILQDAVSL